MLFGVKSDQWSVLRESLGSLLLTVIQAGMSFAVAVVIARMLSLEAYGRYVYAMAFANILVVPSVAGLPRLIVREVATARASGEWSLATGLIRRGAQTAFALSIGLAVFAVAVERFILQGPVDLRAVITATAAIPGFALLRVWVSGVQGLGDVTLGQVPEKLVRFVFVFIGIAAIRHLQLANSSEFSFLLVNVLAAWASAIAARVLYSSRVPAEGRSVAPAFAGRVWLSSASPLLLISLMNILSRNVDAIVAGSTLGAESAGMLQAAKRISELLAFGLLSVGLALGPVVATRHAERRLSTLQPTIQNVARASLLFSLLTGAAVVVWGEWLLGLFGTEFGAALSVLRLLVVASIVATALGPGVVVLSMTGHERQAMHAVVLGGTALIILDVVLIPLIGVIGAAAGGLVAALVTGGLAATYVARRLKLNCTVFGRHRVPE